MKPVSQISFSCLFTNMELLYEFCDILDMRMYQLCTIAFEAGYFSIG